MATSATHDFFPDVVHTTVRLVLETVSVSCTLRLELKKISMTVVVSTSLDFPRKSPQAWNEAMLVRTAPSSALSRPVVWQRNGVFGNSSGVLVLDQKQRVTLARSLLGNLVMSRRGSREAGFL